MPKPLIAVAGKPLLGYALKSLEGAGLPEPIVAIDYLGDLIEKRFEGQPIRFRRYGKVTLAEVVLRVAEEVGSEALLGMSADVLLGQGAVREALATYGAFRNSNTLLVARLPAAGHKRWHFSASQDRLRDIEIANTNTRVERVLLILRRDSLLLLRRVLGRPISTDLLPAVLKPYATGWTMLVKSLLHFGVEVDIKFVSIPVCNVNTPDDLMRAEEFAARHLTPGPVSVVGDATPFSRPA